jgi:hypothetical protein
LQMVSFGSYSVLVCGTFPQNLLGPLKMCSNNYTVAKPIFTLESRTDMYPVYERSAHLLVQRFLEASNEGRSVDIQTLFKRFTLDTFGEIGFGTYLIFYPGYCPILLTLTRVQNRLPD